MVKTDTDLAMVVMKKKMDSFIDSFSENRDFYISEKTIELMAKSALNVYLSIEDNFKFLHDQEMIK